MSFTLGNQTGTTSSAGNPRTQNFNIGAAGNLLVVIAEVDNSSGVLGTATYDGVEMVEVGSASNTDHSNVKMWYLETPHTGTCQFSVVNDTAETVGLVLVSFVSSSGAAAFSRKNTGQGTSTNPSINVTGTVANSLMVGACTDGYRTQVTQGANYTSLRQRDAGNWTFCEEYDLDTSGAGTIAVNFVHATSDTWGIVAASFKETTPPTTISLKVARITSSGKSLSIQKGAVTTVLKKATIQASGRPFNFPIPETTISLDHAVIRFHSTDHPDHHISLDAAQVATSGRTVIINTGVIGVTINLKVASITSSGKSLSIQKGSVSNLLDPATISASGKPFSIQKGTVSPQLQPARITSSGRPLSVQKGAVTISLGAARIAANGKVISLAGATSLQMKVGRIISSGRSLSVQKGEASISLKVARITSSGKSLSIQKGAFSVQLKVASIAASGKSLSIQKGAVSVQLKVSRITAAGKSLSVQMGASTLQLDAAIISSAGKSLSIQKGAVSVQLQPARITSSGRPFTLTTARTYYLDYTGGSDSNDGLAIGTAWQHINNRINSGTFSPGDRILLKCGEEWRGEYLAVPSSGVSGSYITFGNYGTGSHPIINPTLEYNDFTLYSGSTWRRSVSWVDQVFEDNVRLQIGSGTNLAAGCFYDSGGYLYVRCTDDGNPNTGHVIEHVSNSNYEATVTLNNQNYIIFEGIDLKKGRWGYCLDRKLDGSDTVSTHDIIFKDCVISWGCRRGISMGHTLDAGHYNVLATGTVVHDCNGEGFWFGNGHDLWLLGCEVYNGKIEAYKLNPLNIDSSGVIVGVYAENVLVRGCYFHDNAQNTLETEYEGGEEASRPLNVIWEENHSVERNLDSSIYIEHGNGTIFRNNVLEGYQCAGILFVANGATNPLFYNNTIVATGTTSFILNFDDSVGVVFKNNIFYGMGSTNVIYDRYDATGTVMNNNDYYGSYYNFFSKDGYNSHTLADWQTHSSQDANSIDDDPLFVTNFSDLHLQALSPCKNAGATGTVTTDYDGNPRDAIPDIGAYEVQGAFILLDPATISSSGRTSSIQKGAVSVQLKVARVSSTGKPLSVSAPAPGTNISLKVARITSTGKALSVQKGAVSISLDHGQIVSNGKHATISTVGTPVTISLDHATITANAKALAIQKGAVSIGLDAANVSTSGRALIVLKDAVTISLDPAQLAARGRSLSIQKGAVSISLDPAQIHASGQHITIIVPFAQSISLDHALITLSARALGGSPVPPPTPAACIPSGGGGGFLRMPKNIVIIMPEDNIKKKRKEEEEILTIT